MISVENARAILKQSEAAAAAERKATLVAQLKTIRAELLSCTRELAKREQPILKAQADLDAIRGALVNYDAQLGSLEKPAVADYLPDDPEVQAWRKQSDAIVAEMTRLRGLRSDMPGVERMRAEAVQLQNTVNALQHQENGLLNTLNNSLGLASIEGRSIPS
jgi:hypothetical protein